ncbi:MAG: PSD1 and planctomycete cytochrome C domain-containing protein [Acidobacteria bacterium]|nr:PSD1 and planctomycete cytochrome C domain-containing protein [Bryobacteraceae bacterium CoA2 C42]
MGRFSLGIVFAAALLAQQDAASLLEQKCLHCHGGTPLGKLDLRTREAALRGGEHGAAIVPGAASTSKLIRMVSGLDTPRMPLGGALSPAEIDLLQRWITAGAPYPGRPLTAQQKLTVTPEPPLRDADRNWWAFSPIRAPGGSIDQWLNQALAGAGITPAPRAPKATLVRRAYLDLLGLPPTPAEVAAFVHNPDPQAWPKLIDHLLASPHYGERWGRHWLDLARYADSNGYEHDFDRPHAWRYRDYVIRAFNDDKPYHTFLTEQLAGDEIPHPTYDSLTATGFLRGYAKVGFREKDNPEFRYEYLDDIIATIGRGLMGLTVQCARCHDHKFDPISQTDYYRMQAGLFGYVELDHPLVPPAEAQAWRAGNARIDQAIAALRDQLRSLEAPYTARILPEKYKRYPANVQQAIATPEAERTPGQVLLANRVIRTTRATPAEIDRLCTPADLAARRRLQQEITALEKQRPPAPPLAMGVTDGDYRFTPDGPGDEPAPGKGVQATNLVGSFLHEGPGRYTAPPSFLLIRGDRHAPAEPIGPGFPRIADPASRPTALPPPHGKTSGRRLALAHWLTAPEHPLTARVMANRIWHHHFGRGLVASLDNFGRMGDRPTHPALLDYLATEFRTRGWSIKALHRLIMTSEAYQRDSTGESGAAADPANRLLWRFPMRRLEAEIVRDQVLAVSGALNRTLGGPAVFPPLPEELLASSTKGIWHRQPDGPETWRRSVYVYRKRGLPFPLFEIFDLPDQNIACGARNVSTVPTQALYLMNDPFLLRQATLFAGRIREAGGDPVDHAFQLALARAPRPEERAAVDGLSLEALAQVILNLNEFLYLR